MNGLWHEVRIAVRSYLTQPSFTVVAVLILALGIGANTAIYTLVETVAFRPLPVEHPNELYRLGDNGNCCVYGGLQGDFTLFSYPLYRYFAAHTPEFTSITAFQAAPVSFSVRRVGAASAAEPAIGEFVSATYFTTLGVRAAAGRTLLPDDDRPDRPAVAVMSYRTWRERYGGDPGVIGADFTLNSHPLTIVGVAAPEFFGETLQSDPPAFWIPLGAEPAVRRASSLLASPGQHWLYALGRLPTAVAPAIVQAHLSAELQSWLPTLPDITAGMRAQIPQQYVVLTRAGAGVSTMRDQYAGALGVLATVSALLLLLSCANLANLLLARAQPFQGALRAALGASRWRLVRQMLTGGVLLALAGGAAGILVAYEGTRAILALAFRGANYVPIDAAPSPVVLALAILVSLVTAVIFSAMPALLASKANPIDALRGVGRSTVNRSTLPLQALVVLQIAVSLVLLVGAGLLTESLRRLEHQPFGFETAGRVIVRVNPLLAGYTPERLAGLYAALQDRLSRLPGVIRASLSQYSPMEGNNVRSLISIEGRPFDPAHRDAASWLRVGPQYFETIGTRLERGRAIDDRDTPGSLHIAVVNHTFATKFYGSTDPIGRHFGIGDAGHTADFEIVGIVEDAKYQSATDPAFATFFLPLLQTVSYEHAGAVSEQTRSIYIGDIELQVTGRPANLEAQVRRTLAEIDPDLTVLRVVAFDEQLGRNFNQERLVARLTALYSQLALLLAAVGLYGVTAHQVRRRTREIGLRMALGAGRRQVLTMVLGRALLQTGLGVAIGLPIALVAGRALSSQLYGVTGHDPLVVNVAVFVLALSAVVAAFIPARRAASIDPMSALRAD